MNAGLKNFLVIAAKNAVNAGLTSLTPILQNPQSYNWNTKSGWIHLGELVGGAVLSREITVWVPKLMAWSTTSAILFGVTIYGTFVAIAIHYIR